jgi:hypothetical protein
MRRISNIGLIRATCYHAATGRRHPFVMLLRVAAAALLPSVCFVHETAKIINTPQQMKDWMHLVLQGAKTSLQIKKDVGGSLSGEDVTTLLKCVRTKPLKLRNRALALLAHGNRITPGHIASFLCVTRPTARQYISDFKAGGIKCVLDLSRKEVKKAADPNYAASVFSLVSKIYG